MKKTIYFMVMILLLGFWFLLTYEKTSIQPIDTQLTYQQLAQLDNQNIDTIKAQIDKIQKTLHINKTRSLAQRYAHSVVVGDSMVQALMDYQALPAYSLAGAIGRRTDNIYDQVDIALMRQPNHIFLCLGINDLSMYENRFERFEAEYQKVIEYIQQRNPAIKIYINSILPLPKETIKKHPDYQYINDYNKIIQKLCQKKQIGYVDNSKLTKPELKNFESDGTHPKYPYYAAWIKNMADTALLE